MSRYKDRRQYFDELAESSRAFFLDYAARGKALDSSCRVLEIGCGEGGNLLPFAELGCQVTGTDLAAGKIENARLFFEGIVNAEFFAENFIDGESLRGRSFDLIIIHDVIEHIEPEYKLEFMSKVRGLLAPDGLMFWAFPAWKMPFGGHQQICSSKWSRLPWLHLLPAKLYRHLLLARGENPAQVEELMSIRRSRMSVESFEKLARSCSYGIVDRTLWLINPHYRVKFGLRPLRLPFFLNIPWLRNFFCTSCFYLLRDGNK